ncbi:unnamed protein product [Closterium sp. Naga37s-1]|nr:unnamed protein product [Closterium sp. Naga37s-1]
MPRYYCDYCDTYLTHDSPSVRKQHNAGYKHKANVRTYYQQYEEEQTQSLIDQRIRDHLGSVPIGSGLPIGAAAAAAAAGGGAAPGGFPQQLLRPGMPPMGLPGMPGMGGMPGMLFGMPGGAGRGAVLPLPGQFFDVQGMRPPMGGMMLMRPSR